MKLPVEPGPNGNGVGLGSDDRGPDFTGVSFRDDELDDRGFGKGQPEKKSKKRGKKKDFRHDDDGDDFARKDRKHKKGRKNKDFDKDFDFDDDKHFKKKKKKKDDDVVVPEPSLGLLLAAPLAGLALRAARKRQR